MSYLKRIGIFILVIIVAVFSFGCTEQASEQSGSSTLPEASAPTKDAADIIILRGGSYGEAIGKIYQNIISQTVSFAAQKDLKYESISADSASAVKSIVSRVISGASLFVCVGRDFSSAVKQCAESYGNVNFVLFDGMLSADEIPQNLLQISYSVSEIGFVYGYSLAKTNIVNFAFIADKKDSYSDLILQSAAKGAEFFSEQKAAESETSGGQSAKITITPFYLDGKTQSDIADFLNGRRENKLYRAVCLGKSAAEAVSRSSEKFVVFADGAYNGSRLAAGAVLNGEYDISSQLELIFTAGDGWSKTYGGKSIALSSENGYISFNTSRIQKSVINSAVASVADGLSSENGASGFKYVLISDAD